MAELTDKCIDLFRDMDCGNCDNTHKYNPLLDRYSDIKPGPHRPSVIYAKEPLYINANFTPAGIIACQAPRISGIMRWWLMIIQHDIKLIVMLTKLIENDIIKADLYWPTKSADLVFTKSGKQVIRIHLVSEDTSARDIAVRYMDIYYSGTITRAKHICYSGWGDHGVPSSTHDAKLIIKEIHKNRNHAIVHCSAGVGRTGVIILAYQLRYHGGEPLEALREIRHYRPSSVQGSKQFKFAVCLANEMNAEACAAAKQRKRLINGASSGAAATPTRSQSVYFDNADRITPDREILCRSN